MIAIGSDHAGFVYKQDLKAVLANLGHETNDVGTSSPESTDYPDYATAVSEAVRTGKCQFGILICGTGIGMSIAANRHPGIRAAVCESVTAARLARAHNNANVLCFGARVIGWETVLDIVRTFLSTPFDGGERHERRIAKIDRAPR
jgi:ribose 5-phosphate isomerase B